MRAGLGSLGAVLALGALAGGCAHQAELPRGGPVVKDITIQGNQAVSDDAIKSHIVTEGTSWWPFSEVPHFDRNIWRTDLDRIEAYYRQQGYYQAKVTRDEVVPSGKNEVRLFVQVKEGPPTRVAKLDLSGLGALPADQQQKVRDEVHLRPGDVFLEKKWQTLKDRIQQLLVDLGYAEAKVEGVAKVDLATHRAVIQLQLQPGPRYRIGEIRVVQDGAHRVPRWRVLEQARSAAAPYRWYSKVAHDDIQAAIFNMGVFGAVEVKPGKGNPEAGTIPVIVQVTEAPFHEVAAGAGLGLEQQRNDAHLVAQYTHRDFFGALRRLRLDARAGWAFIPNAYTALRHAEQLSTQNGPIADLSADLYQPRLFHPKLSLHTRAELQRELEPAYSYIGGEGQIGVAWRPRPWVLISPSYHLEIYRLQTGTTALDTRAPPLLYGCTATCVLSYVEETFAYDRRNDPQEPSRGVYVGLSLQQGGGPLGGSFDYLRITPEVRGYIPVGDDHPVVLSGRLKVGTLIPLNGGTFSSPIVARFFSGGDGMRGFSTRRLSPMRLETQTNPDGTVEAVPVPIGGNGLFESSIEARYLLTPTLELAFFMDGGFVTSGQVKLRPSYFLDNLMIAVGSGLRYRTPVGPVRLDLAYRPDIGPPLPVYTAEGGPVRYLPSTGCFGIGPSSVRAGSPEGRCAIHLSIGEAF